MKILITGIAGSGKSTIAKELIKLGRQAVDLDNSGLCSWVNKKTDEVTEYVEGAGKDWIENHRWQVIVPKLVNLLATYSDGTDIFITGKVARIQLAEMARIFDKIILLKPHSTIVDDRLANRVSNRSNFAKTKEERKVIIDNRYDFENECLRVGSIELDNHGTIEEIIKKIDDAINNALN